MEVLEILRNILLFYFNQDIIIFTLFIFMFLMNINYKEIELYIYKIYNDLIM